MSRRTSHFSSRLAGSTLMVATTLMVLVSVGAMLMARTLVDTQRQNTRRREFNQAYYAAEAGVDLVKHWGNVPSDFTPSSLLFKRISNDYILLKAAVASSSGVTISGTSLKAMGLGTLTASAGETLGTIEKIQLLGPSSTDPVTCMFKVQSTGRSKNGVKRTVLAYMKANLAYTLVVPAALISYDTAAGNGNVRIHWGKSWSQGTFSMMNKSQMDHLASGSLGYDPDASYWCLSDINFPTNWSWGVGKDLYDPSSSEPGQGLSSWKYANGFHQNVDPSLFPSLNLDYQTFKDMAIANGCYYGTDSSGNIYRGGIKDAAHKINFMSTFGVPNRSTAPFNLVFIDTTNAQPPASDGSNLSTISVSGNSLGLKGLFWIGANFDASGIGSPPAVTNAEHKTSSGTTTVSLSQIFNEGVFYAAGTLALSGNAGIYGSVIAARGFVGTGTPDVYYNYHLAEGLTVDNGNVGSAFTTILQNNF